MLTVAPLAPANAVEPNPDRPASVEQKDSPDGVSLDLALEESTRLSVRLATATEAANKALGALDSANKKVAEARSLAAAAEVTASGATWEATLARQALEQLARNAATAGGQQDFALIKLLLAGEAGSAYLHDIGVAQQVSSRTAVSATKYLSTMRTAKAAESASQAALLKVKTAQAEAEQAATDAASSLTAAQDAYEKSASKLEGLVGSRPVNIAKYMDTPPIECVDIEANFANFANGRLPEAILCPLPGRSGQRLTAAAAASFTRMAAAFEESFGEPLCITDSYRSFELQVLTKQRKPRLAAKPGTSNHGWGVAVDACGGIESFTTRQHRWMVAHAGWFGWSNPEWAQASGSKPEPWHWEYSRTLDEQMSAIFELRRPQEERVGDTAKTAP